MSIILAASMTVSLAACGGKNNTDTLQPETQESVQTEINTETPAEPETDTAQESASKYTVTGENDNKELTILTAGGVLLVSGTALRVEC